MSRTPDYGKYSPELRAQIMAEKVRGATYVTLAQMFGLRVNIIINICRTGNRKSRAGELSRPKVEEVEVEEIKPLPVLDPTPSFIRPPTLAQLMARR